MLDALVADFTSARSLPAYVGIIIHRKIILRNERRKVCMNGLIFSQSYVLWVIREYHNGRRIKVFILLDYTNSHLTMIMK